MSSAAITLKIEEEAVLSRLSASSLIQILLSVLGSIISRNCPVRLGMLGGALCHPLTCSTSTTHIHLLTKKKGGGGCPPKIVIFLLPHALFVCLGREEEGSCPFKLNPLFAVIFPYFFLTLPFLYVSIFGLCWANQVQSLHQQVSPFHVTFITSLSWKLGMVSNKKINTSNWNI